MSASRFAALILLLSALAASLAESVSAASLQLKVSSASLAFDQRSGQALVTIRFTPESTLDFERLTCDNVGRRINLRVDGKTVQQTVIREPIMGGSGQILVPNPEEGRALAARLSAGTPLEIETAD